MRLVWLEVSGYGRIAEATVNFDGRVIALLGANESGKTTLLRALQELGNGEPVDPRRQTRGAEAGEKVCEGWFLLEPDELARMKDAVPEAESARWYVLTKAADGNRTHRLHPRPTRVLAVRTQLAQELSSLLELRWAKDEKRADFCETVAAADPVLSSTSRQLSEENLAILESLGEALASLGDEAAPKRIPRILEHVRDLVAYEKAPHPSDQALKLADGWCPDVLMFAPEDRALESEYDLTAVQGALPPALSNLAGACGLDTSALVAGVASGRTEIVEDLLSRANERLAELFGVAWSQSTVEVRLSNDDHILRVFVRADEGDLHRVAERSDGLKIFVCLVAFLATHGANRPILLIDEAEQHLHWDAQADLVGMLHRQDRTGQVIYSTHSPGCLPQDLGAGLRLVVQRSADRSEIRNSFWSEGPGLAPLLLAMGAGSAALTPARHAVVAEGASDFILLPALFREVDGVDFLEFQVVPGLAEATAPELRELELQAARVAYLADGDLAGDKLQSRLLAAGVSESRIVRLPTGMALEDFIAPDALTLAVHEELRRSGQSSETFTASELPDKGRAQWLDRRLTSTGIEPPSKTRISARLLELASPTIEGVGRLQLLDSAKKVPLRKVLRRVEKALELA